MLAVLTHNVGTVDADHSRDEAGFFHLVTAIAASLRQRRRRAVERRIGAFVEARGARITDDVEREIAQRFD